MPEWLRQLDHTADAGFTVTAPDRETLYARAAWGLFSILTDVPRVAPRDSRTIRLEADDPAALMVKWLSELNFIHITEHVLFRRFEVRLPGPGRLEAEVSGEPIDPGRHTVYTEVKAVTYHGMEIEQRGESWRAVVIVDL